MSVYEIHPLQTARTIRPTSNLTYLRNFGDNVEMFYGAFLIKDADRSILVDTGCDAQHYAAGPLLPIEDVESLEKNLSRHDLTVKEIDAVILTHLHFDHAAFLDSFTHCPKFVQERELKAAFHPHPYFSDLYVPVFFKDVDFEMIDGEMELFPGIQVVPMPGHSAGTQAIIVETGEGRAAVSGFCCVAENFHGSDLAIPGIHEDVQQAYDSMHKLVRLADIIFPNHSRTPVKLKK